MAQFPWKKGKKTAPTYDDLAAEMDKRFNKSKSDDNVQYTTPTTAKPKRPMRIVGKTGYK